MGSSGPRGRGGGGGGGGGGQCHGARSTSPTSNRSHHPMQHTRNQRSSLAASPLGPRTSCFRATRPCRGPPPSARHPTRRRGRGGRCGRLMRGGGLLTRRGGWWGWWGWRVQRRRCGRSGSKGGRAGGREQTSTRGGCGQLCVDSYPPWTWRGRSQNPETAPAPAPATRRAQQRRCALRRSRPATVPGVNVGRKNRRGHARVGAVPTI